MFNEYKIGTVEGTGSAINVSCGFLPRMVNLINIDGNAEMKQVLAEAKAQKRATNSHTNPTSNIITEFAGSSPPATLAGTSSVDAASGVVTGIGTAFTSEVAVDDMIDVGGVQRIVLSIASDTSLTVTENFSAAQSGATVLNLSGAGEGFTIGADTDLNVSGETIKYIAYR